MSNAGYDPIKSWFLAGESMGEFIGMRFARIPPGKSEPDWIYIRHCDYDGIGAIKKMFTERGGTVRGTAASASSRKTLVRFPVQAAEVADATATAIDWKDLGNSKKGAASPQPAPAAAWHVFGETETLQMRKFCNAAGVTVNSFLLQHLTAIIRPYRGGSERRLHSLDDSGQYARSGDVFRRTGQSHELPERDGACWRFIA